MLVYRVCSQKEISTIFQEKSLKSIGKVYPRNPKYNTHAYHKNQKYIHFFEYFEDIFYLNSSHRNIICTYDLPEDVLKDFMGFGFYLDCFYYETLQEVVEYAVPCEKVRFSSLQKVEEITDTIFIEDYIEGHFREKIETVYDSSKGKNYCKK